MSIKEKREKIDYLNGEIEVISKAVDRLDEALGCIASAKEELDCVDVIEDGGGLEWDVSCFSGYLDDAENGAETFKSDFEKIMNKHEEEIEKLREELKIAYDFSDLCGNALIKGIESVKAFYKQYGCEGFNLEEKSIWAIIEMAKKMVFDVDGNIIEVDGEEV